MTCSVPDCEQKAHARGWCRLHYFRWQRYGDPLTARRRQPRYPRRPRSVELATWRSMIARCSNPKVASYPRYGARGIKVCERWHTFANFLADMGPRPEGKHSIDRIDNNGNYEPGNVRWATRTEQMRNYRNNRMVTVDERTLCVSAWAEVSGTNKSTIKKRLNKGWEPRRAIFGPPLKTVVRADHKVSRIARMLAGYDDTTWDRLRADRKRTYERAGATLIQSWETFQDAMKDLTL